MPSLVFFAMNDLSRSVTATITSRTGKEEIIQVEIGNKGGLRSLIDSVTILQTKVNESLTKLVEEEKTAKSASNPSCDHQPSSHQPSSQGSEPDHKKAKTE